MINVKGAFWCLAFAGVVGYLLYTWRDADRNRHDRGWDYEEERRGGWGG